MLLGDAIDRDLEPIWNQRGDLFYIPLVGGHMSNYQIARCLYVCLWWHYTLCRIFSSWVFYITCAVTGVKNKYISVCLSLILGTLSFSS